MWCRFSLALAITLFSFRSLAQEAPPAREATSANIQGVWKITELASRVAGGNWEARPAPYLSQYLFTTKHYSYMYAPAPRTRFAGNPNRPTDAEKVEAYNTLVAATGTYSISGRNLTMIALVHKNPNEMIGEALTYAFEIDGSTLRLVIANPPFLPAGEWRTVLTKVE